MRVRKRIQRATTWLRRGLRSESAGELVEYALVTALIALAAVAAVSSLGCEVRCVYENLATGLEKGRDNIPPGQMQKCVNSCR